MKLLRAFLFVLIFAPLVGCGAGVPFYCNWSTCLFLPSCRSLELFSDEYRVRLESFLPQVQFYLSRDLVLVRDMEITEERIEAPSHRVRLEKNRRILEIRIPAGTPGVLREATPEVLWVAFENPGDGLPRRIPFRRTPIRTGQADMESPANFVYQFSEPIVRYEGERFEARFTHEGVPVSPEDVSVYAPPTKRAPGVHRIRKTFYPALMIDLVEQEAHRRERRTAEGLRVRE